MSATYKIEIAEPIVSDLKDFAKRNNITLEEASMRAFALLSIANTASKEQNTLGIIHKEQGKPTKIVAEIEITGN